MRPFFKKSLFLDVAMATCSITLRLLVSSPTHLYSICSTLIHTLLPYRHGILSGLGTDLSIFMISLGRSLFTILPIVLLASLSPAATYVAGLAFAATYLFKTADFMNYLMGANSNHPANQPIHNTVPFSNGERLTYGDVVKYFEDIMDKAGNPDVKLYFLPTTAANAFAITNLLSWKRGSITLTTGLINQFIISNDNDKEACKKQLQAIICHEARHILKEHTKFNLLANIFHLGLFFSGAISTLTTGTMLALAAACELPIHFLSRAFEYDADSFAVDNGLGEDMILALKTINNERPDYPSKFKAQESDGGWAYRNGISTLNNITNLLTLILIHFIIQHPKPLFSSIAHI